MAFASRHCNATRRDFVKAIGAAAAAAAIVRTCGTVAAGLTGRQVDSVEALLKTAAEHVPTPSGVAAVRPIIGTGWHGHTFPGAVAPFGLVQLSPDSAGNRSADPYYGWDHCPGYHYSDNTILGFSHTHLQGTGAKDLGDILLMPVIEGVNWYWNAEAPGRQHETQLEAIGPNSGWVSRGLGHGYASRFSHADEKARAGYYSVYLQTPQVKAELTATTRCGMHRYTYPALSTGTRRGLILDMVHGLGCSVYHAELHIESSTRVSGKRYTHGWAADKQVYFVMEFSRPFQGSQVMVDGKISAGSTGQFTGTQIKAIFEDSPMNKPLVVRVGLSCTGIEGAKKNLAEEISTWNFDAVRRWAGQVWGQALAIVDARLPSEALTQAFYTAVYHATVAPATFNDVDGTYRGEDRKNHASPGFTNYTTMSIWDIYRAQFPFMMLTQPARIPDVINTLLTDYRQLKEHSLPVWPLWGNETWCMTGFHVVGMILGAYVRGFRGFDVSALYAAMRDTALVGATANNNNKLQEEFRHYGYVPTGPQKQSVSRTLDFAYDYWCVGAMAELLGQHDDAKRFYQLANNYKNLFDPATGFMRGKTADGKWRQPFRSDQDYTQDYTESDAWQATFNVMQDVRGLIALYGGDRPFIAKLDAFFTAPSKVYTAPPDISGMVGQDAQGNEPSNHIPYLYSFAGAAWKTQYWVRKVMALYNNTPNGIPGNDDCGQLSSWLVWSALGFYPVNAATGVYVLGSPIVDRAIIGNPQAKTTFTIATDHNSPDHCYIDQVKLNGRRLERSWITHQEIVGGGDLVFRMAAKPDTDWATEPQNRPPSGLIR